MVTLTESKICCPSDGLNLFIIKREFDVGVGDPTLETVCRKCNHREYNEALRYARKIKLLIDDEPEQKLKTK